LKGWFDLSSEEHKANLAQAILALANHGGGFVLIGFTKKNGSWQPEEPRPSNLDSYSQDCVNSIVERYADPSFHCNVSHVAHPQSGLLYPIVTVPGLTGFLFEPNVMAQMGNMFTRISSTLGDRAQRASRLSQGGNGMS